MNQVKSHTRSVKRKIRIILKRLAQIYKKGEFSDTPFCVLVTALLSHRTKDERTASAKEKLFSHLPDPKSIAEADQSLIESLIKEVGFYKVKARRIKEIARIIEEKYKGIVPSDEEVLLSLPGVGRKTAACVLAYGFGIPAIPVDTHLHRIANLLGIVRTKTPHQTEEELKKIVPKSLWIELNEIFVKFGKDICRAKRPKCSICPVKEFCPKY